MDLFTRCHQCETVFRVTTNDLQASGGQVRCGRCQTVFDAFASLTAQPPASVAAQTASDPDENAHQQQTIAPEFRENQLAQKASKDDTARNEANKSDAEKVDITIEETALEIGTAGKGLADDPAANLYEWEFKPAPKTHRTGLWLSVSLLLIVTALAQVTYGFRAQLMVNYPQVRPLYEQICQRMHCEVGLPRLTDQLNIDASDLQLVNPKKPNQVELSALVRNRARVAVEYPAFELTLTDAQEKVVARRVFLPHEYLPEKTSVEVGLAGRGELAVRLYLDTGLLQAAGYRIYLFYPT